MNNYCRTRNHGFTLIELIVVFSIFFLVTTVSLISFGTFSSSQVLNSSVLDVIAVLNEAKSSATSQYMPVPSVPAIACNASSPQLTSYSIRINPPRTYSIWIYCNSTPRPFKYKEKILPQEVSFGTGSSGEILFSAGTGKSGSGIINMSDASRTKTIRIDSQGNINES